MIDGLIIGVYEVIGLRIGSELPCFHEFKFASIQLITDLVGIVTVVFSLAIAIFFFSLAERFVNSSFVLFCFF